MWDIIKQHLHEIKVWLSLAILSKIVKDNLPDFHYKVVLKKVKNTATYIKTFIVSLLAFVVIWQLKRSYGKLDPQMQFKMLIGLAIVVVCFIIGASSKNKELKAE